MNKESKEERSIQGIGYVVGMARLALLADPTFRESWEIHRWGYLDEPLLSSVVFPVGTVLEPLFKHGHRDDETLERLFQKWEENNYHYFDERCSLPPDIDLMGLMLRLHRYRLKTIDSVQVYRIPLKRLELNRLPSGEIPVWLMNPVENDGRNYSKVAGNQCDICLANLLIGLWQNREIVAHDLLKDATLFLLSKLIQKEMFHNEYYPSLIGLWRLAEFASLVRVHGSVQLSEMAIQSLRLIREKFGAYQPEIQTPQQAATAVLLSLHNGMEELFKEEWVVSIINQQKYDGLWEAESFYVVPSIGSIIGWHSSRLITTAICYDALMTYLAWKFR